MVRGAFQFEAGRLSFYVGQGEAEEEEEEEGRLRQMLSDARYLYLLT